MIQPKTVRPSLGHMLVQRVKFLESGYLCFFASDDISLLSLPTLIMTMFCCGRLIGFCVV
jgi:hypothetical protein